MTQEEFEHIAPALRELMLSVGRSFFGNDDDAEDVAQEGLVALLRFIDRMEPGARHDALAVRVAKHCCMDLVRKRKSCPILALQASKGRAVSGKMHGDVAPPCYDIGASPHEHLEAKELHEALPGHCGAPRLAGHRFVFERPSKYYQQNTA